MILDETDRQPGARFLHVAASIVIITAGLKLAGPILVPFVLAAFLAVVTMPVMFGLRARGVPSVFAIVLAVLLDFLIFLLIILLLTNSVGAVNARLPDYVAILQERLAAWTAALEARGIPAAQYVTLDQVDPQRVLDLFTGAVQFVVALLSKALLVGLIMVFILAEATILPFKFKAILGGQRGRLNLLHLVGEVQGYLWIKTMMSAGTGLGIGLLCWAFDVDFPILLGLLAFLLNFVPNIGSLLAAIPAVLLTLIAHGEVRAAAVALGYMAVNGMFGNLLETHLFGRRMGLSMLVVFLSLLFWAWVWGPVGALLAVPLTMVVKIALEHVPDLRWIAVLMDREPPQARVGARGEALAAEATRESA
jgi:predicted PurR-regulated permease PerM